ncbi:MAG: 30S ribosomal protein S4 [Planctomycetaceae bacterium]|jgi:small subunit ribosomal protein S4|nr:30S ribosomal protein S4 [Planctomycetaceae bacterium]
MARILGAVCRKCRREGMKLFLKGIRCNTDRCAFSRRQTPPGMHGAQSKRSKMTDYGIHLREKQKVKNFYGVLEKQFRKYFDMAERASGNTGTNLMSILETRLDNVVYRLGFGASRAQSRQLISHGHILINNVRVNIASYLVRPGDVVSLKNRKKIIDLVKVTIQDAVQQVPEFLVRTEDDIPQGVVLRKPVQEDVSIIVQPQLIVELCSK